MVALATNGPAPLIVDAGHNKYYRHRRRRNSLEPCKSEPPAQEYEPRGATSKGLSMVSGWRLQMDLSPLVAVTTGVAVGEGTGVSPGIVLGSLFVEIQCLLSFFFFFIIHPSQKSV